MLSIFTQANRMLLNFKYSCSSYLDRNTNCFGNRHREEAGLFNYNSEKKEVFPLATSENTNHLENRSSKEPRLFNFNPEKEKVFAFVTKVLDHVLSSAERIDIKNLENLIVNLQKESEQTSGVARAELDKKLNKLNFTLENKSLVKEKLKITFEGFDIGVKPIPVELCLPTQSPSTNQVLSLLRMGYLNHQALAQFGLSNAEFEVLSKKGGAMKGEEKRLYTSIIDLVGKSYEFVTECLATEAEGITERKKLLKEISKIGREGKKMYKLLGHLAGKNL